MLRPGLREDGMMTLDEVRQISRWISLENAGPADEDLSGDITCIAYCTDVLACGGASVTNRHIDIAYSFGEFYEIHEETALFQMVCALCGLPLRQEEGETVLYQRDEA